jgi:hypothetical protein
MTSLGTVAWSVTADDAPLRLSGGWVRVDQAVDMAGRATTPYYAHPSKRLSQFEEPEVVRSQNKLSLELVKAAKAGSAAEIDALLQKGAEVNCADPMGTSPAMKAATFGNLDALTRLLEEQPDLTLCNEDGRNALHLAVLWGRCLCGGDGGCVGALIRAGCARNQMDDAGEFPIDLSCRALQPTNGQPLPRFPQTAELRQVQKQIQAMAKWLSFLKCASINTDDYDALFDVCPHATYRCLWYLGLFCDRLLVTLGSVRGDGAAGGGGRERLWCEGESVHVRNAGERLGRGHAARQDRQHGHCRVQCRALDRAASVVRSHALYRCL